MYWFRAENPLTALLWVAVAIVWTLGGWLLASHAFRLEQRERLFAGFGLGLVSYLWFSNLIGRWFDPRVTFIAAAFLVLALGLAYAWQGRRPVLDWKDLRAWKWILLGLVLLWVFTRMARGMAIFDDRKNLSIISTMAAGDIPPHHYMNSTFYFAYHYGFQLLGASLMRLGGLMPWSAYDLSKALVGAYTFVLLALVSLRYVQRPLEGMAVVGVTALSTGARYLLLLAPANLMARIDPLIRVRAPDEVVGMPLSLAIAQGLTLKDGPPAPFLYAFMNGMGWPPLMALHTGPSTFTLSILFLTWLTASRLERRSAWVILAILFSMIGLVWESSYGVFLLGGVAALVLWAWKGRSEGEYAPKWMGLALLVSIPIVLLQGGTITEVVRKAILGLWNASTSSAQGMGSLGGFSLRWPPAIYSGHLGALVPYSPPELFVAILELGLVVLFTPWITIWAWKRFRQGDWMLGVLLISAWVAFLFPIFFSYEYDHDIVRFTKHALLVWTIFLAIMLFDRTLRWSKIGQSLAAIGLAFSAFGGMVITGSELTAASQVVLTEDGINALDSYVAGEVWDRLPPQSEVYDPMTWRATMLTGRLTRVVAGNMSFDYEHSPEWEALRANPSPQALLEQGFQYLYIDEGWWNGLSTKSQASLSAPCVVLISEHRNEAQGQFRRLVDLSQCSP